jgi:hypothetical protein
MKPPPWKYTITGSFTPASVPANMGDRYRRMIVAGGVDGDIL